VSGPDAARRKSTRRFVLRLILVIGVIVVAVYLLLLSDMNRVLRYRLDRLHSKGIPTNWSDVIPPPIPAKANAAILYARAFKLLKFERGEEEALGQLFREDDRPGWPTLRTQPEKVDPKQVAQIIARNQPALDLIRQAAARPRCRFPVNWNDPPYEVLFPYFGSMRDCGRLLAAEAYLAASEGDTKRAIDCYHTMLRLADHASSDPTLISFLTASGIDRMAVHSMYRLMRDTDLDPATCRVLFAELQQTDLDASLRRGMAGEVCTVFWIFDKAAKRADEMQAIYDYYGDKAGLHLVRSVGTHIYLSPLGKLVRMREEITYAERVERSTALIAKPYRETLSAWRAVEEEWEKLPPHYLISRVAPPHFYAVRTRDSTVAFRNAMQVALALKAYRASHPAYPDSLDAVRGAGWTLPDDPFSGKPFGYHRFGPGFILYSWGEDLDDDGGRLPDPRRYPPDGDVLWAFPK
jgi:hypothetical protein